MITDTDHVWITLTAWRLAFCEQYARMRHDETIRYARTKSNNASRDPINMLDRHRLGMLGEAALMLYLTRARPALKWHLYQEGGDLTGLPDFDGWIDVKARSKNWHDLIVQFDDHASWAYVLALVEMTPRICLFGWCWGHEAKRAQYRADPAGGRAAYFVSQREPVMRPMQELFALLQQGYVPHA